jgi:hypothetical protein
MEHGTLPLRRVGWQTRLVPFGRSEPFTVGWTQGVCVVMVPYFFVIDMHVQGDIYRDYIRCVVGVYTYVNGYSIRDRMVRGVFDGA